MARWLLAFAVWLVLPAVASADGWYAGDLHVHTCYSHDAYCPPDDDNTGPDTFYSSGGTVAQRFAEAAAKGLDFLHIADHDDVRAQADPDYGSAGVVAVPGYEASVPGGHAHLYGATHLYDKPKAGAEALTEAAAGANRLADAVERDGGLFQANHPAYRAGGPLTSCDQAELANWKQSPMHWRYGFDVRPSTIEVWNATTLVAPSLFFYDCWLQRGWHVGATAGSDSHGATQPTLGQPTTWVLAKDDTPAAILRALRLGRTTLSRQPPALGALRLLLEGDADRDGKYEAVIGDTVPPKTPLRVRAEGGFGIGFVDVRANGRTILDDAPLAPGGTVALEAPAAEGWVRATLALPLDVSDLDPNCATPAPQDVFALCSSDLALSALTSPIYVARAKETPPPAAPEATPTPTPEMVPAAPEPGPEPDGEPPLSPQAQGGGDVPPVPTQSAAGEPVRAGAPLPPVTAVRIRRRVVTWRSAADLFDVDTRTRRGHWRPAARGTSAHRLVLRRRRHAVRVRPRAGDGRLGAWVVRR